MRNFVAPQGKPATRYKSARTRGRDIAIAPGDFAGIAAANTSGGRKPQPELDLLSNILKTFNEMFGNIDWKDRVKIGKVIAEELPAKVSADKAYQNAMKNSGKQNHKSSITRCLKRAVIELLSDHPESFKQSSNYPSFKKWLSKKIFAATYADAF
jgi:type I restriction enzyme R subunit